MAKPESLAELRKQWRTDRAFIAEYLALEDEFDLVEGAIIVGANSKRKSELNNGHSFGRGKHGSTTRN